MGGALVREGWSKHLRRPTSASSDTFSLRLTPNHPAHPAFAGAAVRTHLYSTPEAEEEGLDLDLAEMFEMFDAADKEEDFDAAVKKVKGGKEDEK